MSNFNTYFWLGYDHITDFEGFDHMLFLLVLTAVYQAKDWLRILIVVSLFTLGHSVTLLAAQISWLKPSVEWIEFLIPITILITALYNITQGNKISSDRAKNYLALIIGLIHGLGFNNYYQMLETDGFSYLGAMLPFNLGIELGQLVVVIFILGISMLIQNILNFKAQDWTIFVSGGGFSLALWLAVQNWPL